MNSKFENNELVLYLEGKIDSTNADAIGAEMSAILAEHDGCNLIVDADNLEYISSAGLRQILKLKKANKTLKIVNVSSAVYEVFEMTGFTEMMDIQKGYRKLDVSGCEILGEGSNGIVYRYSPEIIVKVYRNNDALDDIKRERELARTVLVLGINTAIPFDVVKVGDKYGSVFELLDCASLSKLIIKEPENRDKYIKVFSDLLKEIHDVEVPGNKLPEEKDVVVDWVNYIKGQIDDDHWNKLSSLVNAVPTDTHMIHGDYHTNNIHYSNGEAILIDMDTIATGNPIFELGSVYNAYQGFSIVDHTHVEGFLHMDYETATYVWQNLLKNYCGTDDISDIEYKAKVVGLTRILRRTLRREPDNKAMIEESKRLLIDALDHVDSLLIK